MEQQSKAELLASEGEREREREREKAERKAALLKELAELEKASQTHC